MISDMDRYYDRGFNKGLNEGENYIADNVGNPLYWDWNFEPDMDYYRRFINEGYAEYLKLWGGEQFVKDSISQVIKEMLEQKDNIDSGELGWKINKALSLFLEGFYSGFQVAYEEWWDRYYDNLIDMIEEEDMKKRHEDKDRWRYGYD